jgi:hypothetical protein
MTADLNTALALQEIIDRVRYPGHRFLLRRDGDVFYMQVEAMDDTCNVTGAALTWRGRKWMLSKHMTPGEVVQTCFKAVLTSLEHEAREKFSYRGACVFDPHYDIEKLVELRTSPGAIQERSPYTP